jgi:hypothetical protein
MEKMDDSILLQQGEETVADMWGMQKGRVREFKECISSISLHSSCHQPSTYVRSHSVVREGWEQLTGTSNNSRLWEYQACEFMLSTITTN